MKQEAAKRLHFQADLEKERDFIGSVLEIVGALVVVLNRTGQIVRYNRRCETLMGYTIRRGQRQIRLIKVTG